MTINFKNLAVSLVLLSGCSRALQVTPNSPCAAKCLDNPNQDPATTDRASTFGSEIVCLDADYQKTKAGQKYQDCVSCLQTSSATAQGENDQNWFLYNLRYTLDTCLFNFANATDAKPSPCLSDLDSSCAPLQAALEDGNLMPGNESEFSYCTADSNAFRGSSYNDCQTCLRKTDDQKYLANFLLALNAGCEQRPPAGIVTGIEGSVFSTTEVNITYAGYIGGSSSGTGHHGLSQSAIIGIIAGLAVLTVVMAAILYFGCRKRKETKQLKALHSPLDARFGANNITAPTDGAYGNPYSIAHNQAIQPFDPSMLSKKELDVLANARSVLAKHDGEAEKLPEGWQLAHQLPAYTGAAVPTHQAYIPSPGQSQISPALSAGSNNSYLLSQYPSSRTTSPKYFVPGSSHTSPQTSPQTSPRNPPPLTVPQSLRTPPILVQEDAFDADPEQYSQIYPRNMHFNASNQSSRMDTPIEDTRASSRNGGWRRATAGLGLGNSTVSTSSKAPINISGPIASHGGRYDFEMADKERKQREKKEKIAALQLKKDDTPVSASSEEMWPGSY